VSDGRVTGRQGAELSFEREAHGQHVAVVQQPTTNVEKAHDQFDGVDECPDGCRVVHCNRHR